MDWDNENDSRWDLAPPSRDCVDNDSLLDWVDTDWDPPPSMDCVDNDWDPPPAPVDTDTVGVTDTCDRSVDTESDRSRLAPRGMVNIPAAAGPGSRRATTTERRAAWL